MGNHESTADDDRRGRSSLEEATQSDVDEAIAEAEENDEILIGS